MSIIVYNEVETPIVPVEGLAGRVREALGGALRSMRYVTPDFAGLYQDAAGTTPVTAVGQPVGLMLDRRLGLDMGPELLTNGGFSDGAASWSLGPDVAVADGRLVSAMTTVGVVASQSIAVQAGAMHRIAFNHTGPLAGQTVVPRLFGGTQQSAPNVPSGEGGEYSAYLAAAEGNHTFRLNAASTGFTGTLSDISVRELPGNHASQATTTARPTLRSGPLRIDYDGVDDYLRTVFPALGSNVTIARSIPGVGAQIMTGQTIAAGDWDDDVTSCATLVIDRSLTGPETALVTAFLNQQAGV